MPLIEDNINVDNYLIKKCAEYVDKLRNEYITDITKQQEREILYSSAIICPCSSSTL